MRKSSFLLTKNRKIATGSKTPATIKDQNNEKPLPKTNRFMTNSVPMQKMLMAQKISPINAVPLKILKRDNASVKTLKSIISVIIGKARSKNQELPVACSIKYKYRPVLI